MIEQIISLLTGKVAVTVETREGRETKYEEVPAGVNSQDYVYQRTMEEIRKNPGATKIEVSDGRKGYRVQSR